MNIPYLSFNATNDRIRTEALAAFERFFDSKWYVLGQSVKDFEAAYAAYSGTEHCVGVANGLDALHISLKVLGVGPGDEVIVPSNTYIASVLAVSMVGATPIMVEPRLDTYNLDPDQVEAAITSRTKAIMPVHLYGQCCEMNRIMAIAERHQLYVAEDNAQAQGATCQGKPTGSWGHINGTSFYPGKNLGALGDGGGITTDSAEWAQACRTLRNYGSQRKYYNEIKGINSRLDEAHAAILQVKLPHLPDWNVERNQIANWYQTYLKEVTEIILPTLAEGCTSVYHIFPIRSQSRDELQAYLKEKGIGTLIHYPVPPHLQEAYQELGHEEGDFPIAEEIAATELSLPLYPGLSEGEVHYICEQIQGFFNL
ncbi:MAG: DegT/DnrJ/EryC1/StrS family aminotransferase [Bacteroidota bacterium]